MKRPELLARREALLRRIASQRNDVAKISDSLSRPLAFINIGYLLVQKIKLHPYKAISSTGLLIVVFRKRINIPNLALKGICWLITPKKLPASTGTKLNKK